MKKHLTLFFYYFVVIMFLELWHKFFIFNSIWDLGILYTILFTSGFAIIFTFLSSLGNVKTNKIVIFIITLLLTFIFCGSFIYYKIFSVPFTIRVTSMASQVLAFIGIIFETIMKYFSQIFILCCPFLFFCIKQKKMTFAHSYYQEKKELLISFIIVYIISLISLFPFLNQYKSGFQLYWNQDDLNASVKTFGLLTAERLDIKRAIFGFHESLFFNNNSGELSTETKYNMIDIDFEALKQNASEELKSVYSYFQNESPTNQNIYTGKYKGKNLIFIVAETFNSMVVDEKLTPTLYKLTNSGFHFTNFYTPLFLSTTGGEFQATTGLVPTSDTLNEWYKGKVYLKYALGNALGDLGYTTNAYHNWESNFYNRDKTMPTLGYKNFLACKNGLEKIMSCAWELNPPSDTEMFKVTLPLYKEKTPFVSNYVTVSGHGPYYLYESTRNYDKVKDLPYSEHVKGYIASQIELDHALETLIKELEKENLLNDTVIALVGDHYPYYLDIDEINELSKEKRDEVFTMHQSDFIIWNNETEKIEINKVGSQIDVLPTLLNLFGVEYDSRLIVGKDILSDTEGLAIFADNSWISDSGSYNFNTKKFIPTKEIKEDYVANMNTKIANSVLISKKIIYNDIYRKIFEKEGE